MFGYIHAKVILIVNLSGKINYWIKSSNL